MRSQGRLPGLAGMRGSRPEPANAPKPEPWRPQTPRLGALKGTPCKPGNCVVPPFGSRKPTRCRSTGTMPAVRLPRLNRWRVFRATRHAAVDRCGGGSEEAVRFRNPDCRHRSSNPAVGCVGQLEASAPPFSRVVCYSAGSIRQARPLTRLIRRDERAAMRPARGTRRSSDGVSDSSRRKPVRKVGYPSEDR